MKRESRVFQTLLQLSDPRGATVDSEPLGLSALQWQQLFALAGAHGVVGILVNNLRPCGANHDSWQMAQRFLRAKLVQALRLRHYGEELLDQLAAVGIPAAEFKGIDFADHLYPAANLRPTSDIDLLVPRDRMVETAKVLERLGYEKAEIPPMRFAASEYGEETWRHRSVAEIEVDLHWNLINHPTLRRKASVEFETLNWNSAGQPSPIRFSATPATRLTIAAAHATFGHQFDRLLLLCDIREACRKLTESDLSELEAIVRRTGMRTAVQVALGTTARFLNDSSSAKVRNYLGGGVARLGSSLVSQQMLISSGGRGHWLRRRLLRELLKQVA